MQRLLAELDDSAEGALQVWQKSWWNWLVFRV